jgi:antitoxin (DNA-binding transcriptional repressor) of toxin-antitoxin stability system
VTGTVYINEAKTHLSKLIVRGRLGEEIVIAMAGEPVARLVAEARPGKRRKLGTAKGQIRIAEDFDDPLPDDLLDLFEGKA